MAQYIVLQNAWANAMEGKVIMPNIFKSTTTTDGRRVVSANALNDFAEDFAALAATGYSLTPIELTQDDFPYQAPNLTGS